jgi:membrane associated rhomboid family serine protease
MLSDRPYMRRDYESSGGPAGFKISATTALLIALVVAFFVQYSGNRDAQIEFLNRFALSTDGLRHGYVWQLLTYQFLHAGLTHIVFNGIALWSFGRYVEDRLGTGRYLTLYFLSGIVGGLFQCLAGLIDPGRFGLATIGASAGIFGLIAAFALMEPDAQILAFFVIPMRAKYLLHLSIAACLILPFIPSQSNMAHAAHLGGILFGVFYIKKGIRLTQNLADWNPLRRRSRREKLIRAATVPPLRIRPAAKKSDATDLPSGEFISQEVDPILDKISAHGIQSLTDRERQILQAARAKMSGR